MAADPNATGGQTTVLESKSVPIDLGSGRKSVVFVPGPIVNRFNVTGDVAAGAGYIKRTRKATTVEVFDNASSTTASKTRTVEKAEWYEPPNLSSGASGGRVVQIPIGSKTTKGNERIATLHFPSAANNAVISNWLYKYLTAHKPVWFKTESGQRYAVVDGSGIADLNPGNDAPAE